MSQTQEIQIPDRAAFIDAMRTVASSVAVVTTDGPAGRHGATVSSFCSVSADPPSMLVCLNAGSRIAKLVEGNSVFNINVLPQGADDIANRFAGAEDARITDRFDGIACSDSQVPAIMGATVLTCHVIQAIKSGSHQIFIGQVSAICGSLQRPLAYHNGAYHQVIPQAAGCGKD